MNNKALLRVKNLSVSFISDGEKHEVLHSVSFNVYKNEILGIVGESGSGKSVMSLATLGLLPKQLSETISEEFLFNGEPISNMSNKAYQKLRGKSIAMIFQEPMSSLNPSMTCGKQVLEILLRHTELSKKEAINEVFDLFEKVKLTNPKTVYNKYPHEISGGQKQRVMIAMAIACKPKLLIADEPTTALDVTVQKEIINLLKELQNTYNMSIIFISHDLALISEIAQRVLVMYNGVIVERGDIVKVFKHPKHNYTKALLASRPDNVNRFKKLRTISDFLNSNIDFEVVGKEERQEKHKVLYGKSPLLELKNIEKIFFSSFGLFSRPLEFKAVNNVSFKLYEGETLGLVGESGCGKSTLGNAILQLDKATSGTIIYKGKDITNLKKAELRRLRKEIQIIFQDPYSSLNPRLSVGEAIIEPMKVHKIYDTYQKCKTRALEIFDRVGLPLNVFGRYPHEFSGGQRQRIGIARAIALNPKIIICDESVSALDISVQAQVLNLLNELKDSYGFTYIFISHDLSVVKYMSDQLVVINKGEIEEIGEADSVYKNPQKDYTKKLIDAIPKGIG